MTLVLTEEQRYLKDTAKDFFQAKSPVEALRKLRDSKDPIGYDPQLWHQIVELGWTAIPFPEDVGGLDFGYTGLGVIMEEAGRTLAATPLMSTVILAGSATMLGGTPQQREELLPDIIEGRTLFALAFEEGPHHAPYTAALRAEKTGGSYRLNGHKTLVLDGHIADHLIVVARTAGQPGDQEGLTLFLVAADAEGITRTRTHLADTRNSANITFDNVEVSDSAVLGIVDAGHAILDPVADRARICLAAEMLGGIQEIFERTVAYLKERRQFGVLIGSFQALQHRAAIMLAKIELAKSTVLAALNALDRDPEQVPALVSLAKCTVSQTYELVSNEAVQLHGGIGVTDELEIGFFLKRARVTQKCFGDAAFHRNRYAELNGY